MKKRSKIPSSSSCSSSSSSSSCIESPLILTIKDETKQPLTPKTKPNKRVRAKKVVNATSTKSRSSIFRGVTRHRCTKRFEAHLWDKTTWNTSQNKRGRQIYLGAYDNEEDAARTYDLAALKYWGPTTILNFPLDAYTKEFEEMQNLTKEEFLASIRRRSNGFSRGVSKYRGVARHHHNGRWEARIGRVSGNKYLYLGTYNTQEEAATAYDMAAIEFRGPNAVTNFNISNYADKLKSIIVPDSSNKVHNDETIHKHQQDDNRIQPSIHMTKLINDSQSMSMMGKEEHMHPWDLCLDSNFDSAHVPDIPLSETHELLELFNDTGFEEDIEFIFDLPPIIDSELSQYQAEVDMLIDRGTSLTSSPSSSTLSTITSVSSDV